MASSDSSGDLFVRKTGGQLQQELDDYKPRESDDEVVETAPPPSRGGRPRKRTAVLLDEELGEDETPAFVDASAPESAGASKARRVEANDGSWVRALRVTQRCRGF